MTDTPGAQAADFFEKILDRVKRLPSVTAATLTDTVPVAVDGNAGVIFYRLPVQARERRRTGPASTSVGKDYFETAGIPILLGRGFRKEDEANGATAVIVSEELVRAYWTGQGACWDGASKSATTKRPADSGLCPAPSIFAPGSWEREGTYSKWWAWQRTCRRTSSRARSIRRFTSRCTPRITHSPRCAA